MPKTNLETTLDPQNSYKEKSHIPKFQYILIDLNQDFQPNPNYTNLRQHHLTII